MNDVERFKAVVNFEQPDYVPIFAFPGAPGMSGGCMEKTHDRLVQTGMPAHVGGANNLSTGARDVASWQRYWGTTGPVTCWDIDLKRGVRGFEWKQRTEGDFEIIECETGAVTRQVIDNAITYSMPEHLVYDVRDRQSWEFWKERMTPTDIMAPDEMETRCRQYDNRDRPLAISLGSTYGFLRWLMGPENLSLTFYDDPQLIHDMMDWNLEQTRRYSLPLLERLRPEIVTMGEDLCYNHGMLLSPEHFHEFCGEQYRQFRQAADACGADLTTIDSDGNIMEFADLLAGYGINGVYPCEVKAGNDLFALRERHPEMVFFGWLEKEVVNEGNEGAIKQEIMSKVPALLGSGRYFPNGDHGIQPLVTFESMCKFMTLLHEVTGNPEGEFPRMQPD